MCSMFRRYPRRHRKGSALAEFGPSLWLFLILILLPLMDMISFAIGVGTTMMLSTWGARMAAPCATYTEALASLKRTEDSLAMFRGLSVMRANTGIGGTGNQGTSSGYKMTVQVTPISGGSVTIYNGPGGIPNTPPPDASNPNVPPVNTMNSVYQYSVTAAYDILPLINFNGIPFFKTLPGVGAPVPVHFTTTATVEHPEGLNN
jgi:hypothetical protein